MATKKEIANQINELQFELGLEVIPVEELDKEHKHADLSAMLKKLQEYEADKNPDDEAKDDGDEEAEDDEKTENEPKGGNKEMKSADLKEISIDKGNVYFTYSDNKSQVVPFKKDVRQTVFDFVRNCKNQITMNKKPVVDKKAVKRIVDLYYGEGLRIVLNVDAIESDSVRELFQTKTPRAEMLKHSAIDREAAKSVIDEYCRQNDLEGLSE